MRLALVTRVLALFLACLTVASCGLGSTQAPAAILVQTPSGSLRGAFSDDHLLFANIPYAAPPVGKLRWQLPQPPAPWQGVRDATKFGLRCVQDTKTDPDFGRLISEDCLYLNVWTPAEKADQPRPVMVWIHGGAFTSGSADIFDARKLVSRGDVIVVTINYRLGALGFLAHPSLAANGSVGNYGFADQQAALRWVHANIAAFGGDPNKVTIAGESAGGMSVCDHLVAPGSAGLFRAAIVQSGPCQLQGDRAAGEQKSLEYGVYKGCPDPATAADCLRAIPAEKLDNPPWYHSLGVAGITGPITGTPELPIDPMTAFAKGKTARVPLMIGTTHDEWNLLMAMQWLSDPHMPDYQKVLTDTFGAATGSIEQQYPLGQYPNSVLAYSATMTDGVFACRAGQMEAEQAPNSPVYGYEFNDRQAPAPESLETVPFPIGAAHSLEVRYLFDVEGAPKFKPGQEKLRDQMIDYWSSFVSTGVPSAEDAPGWPRLMGADGPWMSLQTPEPRTMTSFDDEHKCAFWATVDDAAH